MKNIKYSNEITMRIISIGYLILAIIALFTSLNIMYVLSPYALLTLWIINYTQKRSINFVAYHISFEPDRNENGTLFKFFILASNTNDKNYMFKILKYSQYQTGYILNIPKLQTMMAEIGYSIHTLSTFEPQIVMRASTEIATESINICASHYEEIANEYQAFKNTVIKRFKQSKLGLLEPNVNQSISELEHKRPKSIKSFLLY